MFTTKEKKIMLFAVIGITIVFIAIYTSIESQIFNHTKTNATHTSTNENEDNKINDCGEKSENATESWDEESENTTESWDEEDADTTENEDKNDKKSDLEKEVYIDAKEKAEMDFWSKRHIRDYIMSEHYSAIGLDREAIDRIMNKIKNHDWKENARNKAKELVAKWNLSKDEVYKILIRDVDGGEGFTAREAKYGVRGLKNK